MASSEASCRRLALPYNERVSTVPHSLEPVHFSPQTIYSGDSLDILAHFPASCADLIYIDPPFNSNRNYEVFWGDTAEKRAFDDRYGDAMAYIEYMRPRVELLYRALKPTGSFYYHCDAHASHYIKVMLDQMFGANNFQSEIVWKRTFAHGLVKRYSPIHDNIFFYTKSDKYTWTNPTNDHSARYLEKYFKHIDPATGRRFRTVTLTGPQIRHGDSGKPWRGIDPTAVGRHWALPRKLLDRLGISGGTTQDNLDALDASGLIYWPKKIGGVPQLKWFEDELKGQALSTVWDDVAPIGAHAAERLGYPTQKPVALMERIVSASSNPGDIVLDAFCGCGTTLVAAQQLGRRWVGIDISPTSCNVMGQRLEDICGMKPAPPLMGTEEVAQSWDQHDRYYRFSNLPRSAEQLRRLPGFEFENWAVLQLGEVLKHQGHQIFAQTNRAKVGDLGLDGRIYIADRVSKPVTAGDMPLDSHMGGTGERRKYLPIQVKNTDKVGRPEIDKFETALRRDGRPGGFFIGWDFSKDAEKEIERVKKIDDPLWIIPVRAQQLIEESFNVELMVLRGM